MKRILSLMLILAMMFTTVASVQVVSADEVDLTFRAFADTQLNTNPRMNSTNYGSTTELQIKSKIAAMIRFDLSEELLGISVESIDLRLFIKSATAGETLNISSMTEKKDWVEATVDADDIGTPVCSAYTTTYTFEENVENEWIEIPVADLVNNEGDKIISFYITYTSGDTKFYSKEYVEEGTNNTYAPELHAYGPTESLGLAVESIELSHHEEELMEGIDTLQLSVTFNPPYALNKNIIWESSNENAAVVSDKGLVTAMSGGDGYEETIIRATSAENPAIFDECYIRVNKVGGEGSSNTTYTTSLTTAYNNHWTDYDFTANDSFETQGTGGSARHGYVRFNIPELAGCDISYAQLVLTQSANSGNDASFDVECTGHFNNEWTAADAITRRNEKEEEITVLPETFDTKAPVNCGTATVKVGVLEKNTWDVTDYMIADGDGDYTFKINTHAQNKDSVFYYGKNTSNQPMLIVIARPYVINTSGSNVATESVFVKGKGDASQYFIAGTYDEDGVLTAIAADEATEVEKAELNVTVSEETYTKFFALDSIANAIPRKVAYKHNSGIAEYKYSAGTGKGVKVSGTKVTINGEAAANEIVAYTVVKPEVDVNSVGVSNISEVAAVNQTTADEKGHYTFEFNMPADAADGMYSYAVGGTNSGNLVQSQFYYAKPATAASAVVDALAASEDTTTTKNIIDSAAEKLGIADSAIYAYYLGLEDDQQAAILQGITDELATGSDADDILDIITLKVVDGEDSYSVMDGFISKCYEELLSSADANDYEDLSNSEKSTVAKRVRGDYDTAEQFKGKLADKIEEVKKESSKSSSGSSGSKGSTTYKGIDDKDLHILDDIIPKPTPAPVEGAVTFTDLAGYEWAEPFITDLAAKGILAGMGDGTFAPAKNVTREEFVKMMIVGFGLEDKSATCNFSDVDSSAWYYTYIATANKLGIVKGIDDTTFGVGQNITRQDMAVIAYRAAAVAGIALTSGEINFTDNAYISDYAAEAVGSMQTSGIITGMADGSFAPLAFANRAEAATIIWRLLNK